jgi:uracil-DNA glycosylase family 4
LENKLGTYQIPKYNALQLALNTWGFNESNSYFTHIIKCKMNRHPSPTEIINCSSNIVGELNTLPNLKIIVLIGNIAFKAFTNKSLAAWLYTPMLQRYVLIGIPHPEFAIRTNILYDFSIIYQMYNLTPHL